MARSDHLLPGLLPQYNAVAQRPMAETHRRLKQPSAPARAVRHRRRMRSSR